MLIFTAGERKFIQKPFMICSAVGADSITQQFHIVATTLAHLHLAFEFTSKLDGVHISTQDIV